VTDRRAGLRGSAVSTGRGDDGSTGLLFGGERISKDDPRTEAYGTVDEAVAALGLARAEIAAKEQDGALTPALASMDALILRFQRELFVVGAELAANEDARDRLQDDVSRVSERMLEGVEATLAALEVQVTLPAEFVVPGESRVSASLELARTIVRRAERRVVGLRRQGFAGEWTLPYLNRLADLLWVLARAAEEAESRPARPARTPARPATTGVRGRRARADAGARDPAGGTPSKRPGSPSA